MQKQVGIEGFLDEIASTQGDGAGAQIHFAMTRHDHDRPGASLFVENGDQLEPRHARHADVDEQAARRQLYPGFDEILAAGETSAGDSVGSQHEADRLPHVAIIVEDVDYRRYAC